MKTIIRIITATLLLSLAACQNDGHIGSLFGTWRVESYTADGRAVDIAYPTTFSFEGSVVLMVALTDDFGGNLQAFGSYSTGDGHITLFFGHSDNNNPAGTGLYAPPTWLGMTAAAPMEMVMQSSGRDMTWTWTAPDGSVNIYRLHKTW